MPLLLLLAILCPAGEARAELAPGRARVAAPVADLRKEPVPPDPSAGHDPLEESQLLYGDPVTVLEIQGEWARVAAPDQQEWTHNRRWEGYPGWMRVSDLEPVDTPPREDLESKFGTRYAVPGTGLRERIVQTARAMLGVPYYWGGRSLPDPAASVPPHRGVDCSGLTGLAYQSAGVRIPRDAHEQWMKARPIARENLQPGDLVFLADPENGLKITHVMLYAGDGKIIEGPGTGAAVREMPLEERLQETAGRRVHYGSYF